MSLPLKEGLKEAGRYLISSYIGTLTLCLGIVALGIKPDEGKIVINWTLVYLTALLGGINGLIGAITRFSDKLKHEIGKETQTYSKNDVPSFGLFGF